MNVLAVDISSWTASFKYPNLISGFQPTLEVPPISTILGLINAAAGSYQNFQGINIAYYFEYNGKDVDLEAIYQIGSDKGAPSKKAKTNVIRREFLSDVKLRLYLNDKNFVKYLEKPYYSLLLGRMNDLASVDNIQEITLSEKDSADRIRGQIIPFEKMLPGQIQALPKYFTDTIPRRNLGTSPYSVVNHRYNISADFEVFNDGDKDVDLFFHKINY